ncbi:hypothetical protein AB0B31_35395 [Catellatospora citrea]|uniref:hypothetical protein n=1 Tax=Catellatospora citrea TaxID=53366 RepID=UPI003407E799
MSDEQPELLRQPLDVTFHTGSMPSTPVPLAAQTPKRRKGWPWIFAGITAAALLCAGILATVGMVSRNNPTSVAPSASATAPKPTAVASSVATLVPSSAAPTKAAVPPTKPVYKSLSARDWKLIAKDPDSYIGKTYIVYGVVTQFDAATGEDTFRADISHKNMAHSYEYDTNTLLAGLTTQLKNVVEDDEFRANVTVMGSYSYDTQIGGSTTVPLLQVDSIRIL